MVHSKTNGESNQSPVTGISGAPVTGFGRGLLVGLLVKSMLPTSTKSAHSPHRRSHTTCCYQDDLHDDEMPGLLLDATATPGQPVISYSFALAFAWPNDRPVTSLLGLPGCRITGDLSVMQLPQHMVIQRSPKSLNHLKHHTKPSCIKSVNPALRVLIRLPKGIMYPRSMHLKTTGYSSASLCHGPDKFKLED